MKTKLQLFALMLFTISSLQIQAQDNNFDLWFGGNKRSDAGLSYNFFMGDDKDDFTTTIRGFGSGFLLDAISGRFTSDIFAFGTEDVNLSVGAGVAVSKYRFSENLIIENENGIATYREDLDPNHDYGTGFFSYGKSKMVSVNLSFPVYLNLDVGPFYLSAGGVMDQYLSGKLKRKFKEDDENRKIKVKNDEFNDYPLNKTKFGLSGMILHKDSGFSAGITYMMTPFFKEGQGPDLNEVRISFSYDLSLFDARR